MELDKRWGNLTLGAIVGLFYENLDSLDIVFLDKDRHG